MKQLKAIRIPPGDRWSMLDDDKKKVYSSLTEVLNAIFGKLKVSQFYLDA
mgnify:FL=1